MYLLYMWTNKDFTQHRLSCVFFMCNRIYCYCFKYYDVKAKLGFFNVRRSHTMSDKIQNHHNFIFAGQGPK